MRSPVLTEEVLVTAMLSIVDDHARIESFHSSPISRTRRVSRFFPSSFSFFFSSFFFFSFFFQFSKSRTPLEPRKKLILVSFLTRETDNDSSWHRDRCWETKDSLHRKRRFHGAQKGTFSSRFVVSPACWDRPFLDKNGSVSLKRFP